MAQKKNDNEWKIIVEHTGTPEQQKKVIKEAYRYLRMRSVNYPSLKRGACSR